VKDGSELVIRTNGAFHRVSESAGKVGELVDEIAAASNEQAQGIEQLNRAVADMDQVVQQTAASAEESAGASGEMKSQAEQMKGMVGQLIALVTGGSTKGGHHQYETAGEQKSERKRPAAVSNTSTERKQTISPARRELVPDDIIPMDDSDFKDF